MRPTGHEEDVPAQQSAAEEDPRLPGAHAHQGRPARAEAAPAEGPEAHRGLTLGAPRGGVSPVDAAQNRRRVSPGLRKGSAAFGAALRPRRDREQPGVRPARAYRESTGRGCGVEEPRPPADSGWLPSASAKRGAGVRPRGARVAGPDRTEPKGGGS